MTRYVFATLIGFLSGSIPFCYLLPKLLCQKDICKLSDDHNPGAANVFIHCGIPLGMLCLLLDMGKGLLPVYFASHLLDPTVLWFVPVILAPVWGHALGVFLHGHGGKCIATSFGVLIALAPISPIGLLSLAGLYIFFSTVCAFIRIPEEAALCSHCSACCPPFSFCANGCSRWQSAASALPSPVY